MRIKFAIVALLLSALSGYANENTPFDTDYANSCRNFESFQERQTWWMTHYGPEVVSGALLPTAAVGLETRYGQLTLMKRILQAQGRLDFQKLLVMEYEASLTLKALHGGDSQIFSMLERSAQNVLGSKAEDLVKLRLCAFECVAEEATEISREFRDCIE